MRHISTGLSSRVRLWNVVTFRGVEDKWVKRFRTQCVACDLIARGVLIGSQPGWAGTLPSRT